MPIPQTVIDEITAKNPNVRIERLTHPTLPYQALARSPSRGVYKIFQKNLAEKTGQAEEILVFGSILFPERAELDKMFDDAPALLSVWAGEINEMAGATRQDAREKL